MMLKVGLTGSIATGKSTVLDMMANLGIPTISSDAIVHKLYAGPATAAIEHLFPGVTDKGAVDRAKLSGALLTHPERLTELEAIVHPLVRNEIAYFFKAAEGRGEPLAVADIPLLYEGGFDYGLDAVIVTAVDPAIQRQRALARPGMSGEKLDTILARQLPQAEKQRRATYVIDTAGPIDATQRAVEVLVEKLKANQ
jgi:dephospho-CoA kinase